MRMIRSYGRSYGRSHGRSKSVSCMKSGLFLACICATLIATFGGVQTAFGQTGSSVESLQSMTIVAAVSPNGDLQVQEQITWNFGNPLTPRHGIFRYVPQRVPWTNAPPKGAEKGDTFERVTVVNWDGASSSTAPADSNVSTTKFGDSEFSVLKIGRADTTVTGVHTYNLRYRISGAVVENSLRFSLTGAGWTVPVNEVVARIIAPITDVSQVRCLRFGKPEPTCSITATASGDGIEVRTNGLGVEVLVPLQPSTSYAPPRLEVIQTLGRAFRTTGMRLPAAAIAALLAGAAAALVGRRGRDRVFASGSALGEYGSPERPFHLGEHLASPVEFEPPEGIRPGLIEPARNGTSSQPCISAMLVDLAVRGFLGIETFDPQSVNFRLTRLEPQGQVGPALTPTETALLHTIFVFGPVVTSAELRGRADLGPTMNSLSASLVNEAVERGWWTKDPRHVRRKWYLLAVLFAVLAFFFFVFTAALSTYGWLGLSGFVFAVGVAVFARQMPVRTAVGSRIAARLKGFEMLFDAGEGERIKLAEKAQQNSNLFSEYLPYAMAFGNVDRWVQTFSSLGAIQSVGAPPRPWIYGPGFGFHNGGMVFNDRSLSSAMASFDHSLNSSFSAGAAAAAAASAAAARTNSSSGGGSSSFGGGGSSSGGGGGGSW
jgi:uncharacterized protein (TIGR04222 family)